MRRSISVALLRLIEVAFLLTATGAADCTANSNNEFIFSVDFTGPGLIGQYKVEGCEGNHPTLKVTKGVEYSMFQHDATNWYHPLGLAYYPDGAHGYGNQDEVPELEVPTPSDCDEAQYLCNPGAGVKQAPLYCIDDCCESIDNWNTGNNVPSSGSGTCSSGLDVYEPRFFHPMDQWLENQFSVKFTIPSNSKTAELFYFCHIHRGMSGAIKVQDPAANANTLQIAFSPAAYYAEQDSFDTMCGFGGAGGINAVPGGSASDYQVNGDKCKNMEFVCGAFTVFDFCLEAIDCRMNHQMRIAPHNSNLLITFMEQMIHHHANAVSMARAALAHAVPENLNDDIKALMYSIISEQAAQIAAMQAYLEGNAGSHVSRPETCVATHGCLNSSSSSSLACVTALAAMFVLLTSSFV